MSKFHSCKFVTYVMGIHFVTLFSCSFNTYVGCILIFFVVLL
jgi:hypothetical protein